MEKLKLRYQIYKDKVILFATMFGGSFVGLQKSGNFYTMGVFVIGLSIATYGIIKNLKRVNLIDKELQNA